MGVVYKAEDTKLKRTVALKFLRTQALESEEEKTRFVREAQAVATLLHPNVATIFDFEQVEGQNFIVMEFIREIQIVMNLFDIYCSGQSTIISLYNAATKVSG